MRTIIIRPGLNHDGPGQIYSGKSMSDVMRKAQGVAYNLVYTGQHERINGRDCLGGLRFEVFRDVVGDTIVRKTP